jgi:hypothetical protein
MSPLAEGGPLEKKARRKPWWERLWPDPPQLVEKLSDTILKLLSKLKIK